MSQRLNLPAIRTCIWAAMLGFWLGFALATSIPADTTLMLTTEDLAEAYERGDLSFEELQELLALIEISSPDDQQLNEVTQYHGGLWTQPVMLDANSSASDSKRHPLVVLRYQTYAALRGHLSTRRTLQIKSHLHAADLRADVARTSDGEWLANRARATLRWHGASLELGSIQPRWTGGLLIGPAPRFVSAPTGFARSLLQGRLAGLAGANAHLTVSGITLDALYSSRTDSLLQHEVRGLRASRTYGSLAIAPAILWQRVADRISRRTFVAGFGGIRGTYLISGSMSLVADIAISKRALAFQTKWTSRTRDWVRWRLELWSISNEFRNPTMYAHAQPDRELMFLSEIDRHISNTSIGEQGGEIDIRMGPANATTALHLTWWREHPNAQRAMKVSIASSRSVMNRRLSMVYVARKRPILAGIESSHRAQVRLKAQNVWFTATGQLVHQTDVAPHRTSGQLRCGHEGRGYGLGEVSISVAFDYYDISNAGYFTIRYSQLLEIQPGQLLGLYLRWRSRNADRQALLSLRFRTEISI